MRVRVLPKVISTWAVVGLMAGTVPYRAAAQDAESVALLVPVERTIDAASVKVGGCDYQRPAITGEGLIFACPARVTYTVQYVRVGADQPETRYGFAQPTDRMAPSRFDPRPVYLLDLTSETPEDAEKSFAAAADENRPAPFRDLAALPPVPVDQGSAVVAAADPAPTPEPAPAAPEPAASAASSNEPYAVNLTWSTQYGTLRSGDGQSVETSGQTGDAMFGRITVPPGPGTVRIVSNRNADCAVAIEHAPDSGELLVDLPCREITVTLPIAVALTSPVCRTVTDSRLSCLVTVDQATLDLASGPGWADVTLPLPEGDNVALAADTAHFRPTLELDGVRARLDGEAAKSCAPRQLDLAFVGYCSADTCLPLDGAPPMLSQMMALPDLASASWTLPQAPTAIMVQLVDLRDGGAALSERALNIGPDLQAELLGYLDETGGSATHPLSVDLDIKQYKFGRQMRLYSDAECTQPLDGRVDLSNPGNRAPDVPQCSYFKIYDGDRVRSDCTEIPFNAVTNRSVATLPEDACGNRRIVVLVAENSSLNGRAGQEIVRGLSGVVAGLSESETCAEIDIVRTAGERRDILLHAEDIYFPQEALQPTSVLTMEFVNRSSEVLRDFEWVYRNWGDRLAGIVLVSDGSQVRPADMIDSPAAMAWKIKDVMTYAINFSPDADCEVFENTLLFGNCVMGELDSFEEQLSAGITEGLKAVRKNQ